MLLEFPANSDIFSPSHSCSKPYKPFQFETETDYEKFLDQMKIYKTSIQDFVEEQEEKIKKHKNAINEAMEDWNSFVRYEIN